MTHQELELKIKELEKRVEALEQETCDTCEHSDEKDGSNCYECVKGIRNRYHPQPKTGDEWVDDVVESMKGETSHTIIPQEEMDAMLSGLGDMYEPYKESEDKTESER